MQDCGARLYVKRCQDRACQRTCHYERHPACPGCGVKINFWCETGAAPGERCAYHPGREHWSDAAQNPAEALASAIQSTRTREVFAHAYCEAARSPVPAGTLAVAMLAAHLVDTVEAGRVDQVEKVAASLSRSAREAADTRRIMAEVTRAGTDAGDGRSVQVINVVGDPRDTPGGSGIRELPAREAASQDTGEGVVAAPARVDPGRDKP